MSSDTTNWGSSLGRLPGFRVEESGWKEPNIIQKRGRYIRLVSEPVSSPYWSELEVYVENPGTPDEIGDGGSSQNDNKSDGSASGCFMSCLLQ